MPDKATVPTDVIGEAPPNVTPADRAEADAERSASASALPSREELEIIRLQHENSAVALRTAQIDLDNKRITIENRRLAFDIWIRLGTAASVVVLVFYWLCSVIGIVNRQQSLPPTPATTTQEASPATQTTPQPNQPTRLSDTAMVALLGTTTLNVVLLMSVIARSMFPKNDDKSNSKTTTKT